MTQERFKPGSQGEPWSLPSLNARLRQRVLQFTAGGSWTDQLPVLVRSNLRWFWWDGGFAQASESMVGPYLSVFLLALGANAAQIGLLSALSNLSAALLVLPGAAIVERWGRRKLVLLCSGGGVARVMVVLLALAPLFLTGQPLIYMAIAAAVARTAFGNLSVPAWTALTADIVPMRWRGRYFSSRNIAMGVIGMAVTFLTGQLIARLGTPAGYQAAFGIAFGLGAVSTYCYARIVEPPASAAPQPVAPGPRRVIWQDVRDRPDFWAFCAIAGLWNLSVTIAGPFFSVYLVQDLKVGVGFVGALSMINGLAALPGQRLFGMLADRWGPRRVQLFTSLLIPLVVWGWAASRSPWHLIPVELLSGFLWAGYNLASFNFLLTLIPQERRARYSAIYQIVVTVTPAVGAVVGGLVVTHWGYTASFVLSGLGRLVAAVLFARIVRAMAQAGQPAHLHP